MMQHVLITGFEPFGGETINPSAAAARWLADESMAGASVECLVLPVARYRAVDLAIEALEQRRPDVMIMLGEAGGRTRVTPERVAINLDDYRIDDNAHNRPIDEPIVPGGPAAYFSRLPVRAMVERMRAAGAPAAISNTAGTFLCNHLSYGVLHHIAVRRLPVRAGFIHVPYLPEQAARKDTDTPSMELETMVRGLRAAVRAVLDEVVPAAV
jgi:pyroglutamyl-peptidase